MNLLIEWINFIVNSMNTREIAIIIWVIVFLIIIFIIKNTRKAMFNLFKSFFCTKLIFPFIGMTLYISLISYLLSQIGLLNLSLIKDVIIWFIIGAIPLFYKTSEINKKYKNFFRNSIFEFISITTIISFIYNFYTFNIIIELILVPIVLILTLLIVVSKTNEEYKNVGKMFNIFLTLIFLGLFIIFIHYLLINLNGFININTVIIYILPAILTISLFPYIYVFALYMEYDTFYLRLKVVVDDSNVYNQVFKKVLKKYKLDFFGLMAFLSEFNIFNIRDKKNVEKEILKAEKRVIKKNLTDFTKIPNLTLSLFYSVFNIFENKFVNFYKQAYLKIEDNSTDTTLNVMFYDDDELIGEIISFTTIDRNIKGMRTVSKETTIIAGQNAVGDSNEVSIWSYIFIDDNDRGEKMIISIDFDPIYQTTYNIIINTLIIKQNPSA